MPKRNWEKEAKFWMGLALIGFYGRTLGDNLPEYKEAKEAAKSRLFNMNFGDVSNEDLEQVKKWKEELLPETI